jgi:hypothetical protein
LSVSCVFRAATSMLLSDVYLPSPISLEGIP